jgi:hypothetical protein
MNAVETSSTTTEFRGKSGHNPEQRELRKKEGHLFS